MRLAEHTHGIWDPSPLDFERQWARNASDIRVHLRRLTRDSPPPTGHDGAVPLLLVHAGATCFLAGLCWLVQTVVYPSFLTVGPTRAWAQFHAQHGRRLAALIAVPWATQGVTLALLLLRHDRPLPLLAAAAVCAVGPVLLTVGSAVPLHQRLDTGFDADLVRRLLRVNAVRTLLWSAGAVISLLLVAR